MAMRTTMRTTLVTTTATTTTPTLTLRPSYSKMNPHTPKFDARWPTPTIPRCLCRHSALGPSAYFLPSSCRVQTDSSTSDTLLSTSPRFVFLSFFVIFVPSVVPLLNQVPYGKLSVSPCFCLSSWASCGLVTSRMFPSLVSRLILDHSRSKSTSSLPSWLASGPYQHTP